ncbi:Trm112 family protein [Arthrobacter koreensis]|uniref:Trm112 family protein n=1 Tax=Arthrobacter koreensis TaxID=199136 RepID=UPI003AC2728F
MANLTADLLDVLRCPQTHSRLVQEGDELVSTAPGPDGKPLRYAIAEGIPVLLPASAEPADDSEN